MGESRLISGESVKTARSALAVAKDGGQPWFVIGSIYAEALRNIREQDHRELRDVAAKATRLSPGVLRRYVLLLERLRSIAAVEGLERDALLSPVFNAAEVAVRIYDRNASTGISSLRELKAGEVTLVQLRDRLSTVPVEMTAPADAPDALQSETRMERNERIGRAFFQERGVKVAFMLQALRETSPSLWPEAGNIQRRPQSRFFTGHQGFEVVGKDPEKAIVAGIEMLIRDRDRVEDLEREMPSYLTLATFYDRFYFAFSPGTPASYVSHAAELLEAFNAGSIGILVVSSDGAVMAKREPRTGPIPSRVGDYALLRRDRATIMRRPSGKIERRWQ
jgi:hypothetical protein